jgi:hypothetical protein
MRRMHVAVLFMVVWIAVTSVGLLWGFSYNWPDNGHIDYGLPLTWATNTTSTIAGPSNLWSVNLINLLIDLGFWLGIMTAVIATLLYKLKMI